MSFVETALARLAAIGADLKAQGHQFGEEVVSLVDQLLTAEKPVAEEVKADVKEIGEDAVTAAEPVIAEAAGEPVPAAAPEPAPEAAAPAAEAEAVAPEETPAQ
jgi:2-oxoglutarate dehydrogenase E2 component (dihydrolipoamide succinyltransferase)